MCKMEIHYNGNLGLEFGERINDYGHRKIGNTHRALFKIGSGNYDMFTIGNSLRDDIQIKSNRVPRNYKRGIGVDRNGGDTKVSFHKGDKNRDLKDGDEIELLNGNLSLKLLSR